jgi:membrane protease YdiL (CAAX protease family)
MIKAFLERYSVSTYFVLTYVISWVSILAVIGGPRHLLATSDEFSRLLPVAAMALTAGPAAAGLVMTGFLSGADGFRELYRRLIRWRVGARWYAVALLTAPVLAIAILIPFALRSPSFFPPVLTKPISGSTLVLTAFAALIGGLLEEIGWTGFAIPRLIRPHGVFLTGLTVGNVWGVWHFLINLWGSPALAGGLPLTLFAPLYLLAGVVHLTGYRILMVWAYDHTESLLIVVLMHAALIASTVQTVLTPPTTGAAFLIWFFGLSALFWMVVIATVVGKRRAAQQARS